MREKSKRYGIIVENMLQWFEFVLILFKCLPVDLHVSLAIEWLKGHRSNFVFGLRIPSKKKGELKMQNVTCMNHKNLLLDLNIAN